MVMCQTYFYVEHDITLKNVEESLFLCSRKSSDGSRSSESNHCARLRFTPAAEGLALAPQSCWPIRVAVNRGARPAGRLIVSRFHAPSGMKDDAL